MSSVTFTMTMPYLQVVSTDLSCHVLHHVHVLRHLHHDHAHSVALPAGGEYRLIIECQENLWCGAIIYGRR